MSGSQGRSRAVLQRRANDERLILAAEAAAELIGRSRHPALTMARFLLNLADGVQSRYIPQGPEPDLAAPLD
jgi:hypothetical protein